MDDSSRNALREIVAKTLRDEVMDEQLYWLADLILDRLSNAGVDLNVAQPTMRYRHLKRGAEYEVVSRNGKVQCDDPLLDGEDVVIYRDEKNRYWARHPEEFDDGRFELIPAPTQSKDKA